MTKIVIVEPNSVKSAMLKEKLETYGEFEVEVVSTNEQLQEMDNKKLILECGDYALAQKLAQAIRHIEFEDELLEDLDEPINIGGKHYPDGKSYHKFRR